MTNTKRTPIALLAAALALASCGRADDQTIVARALTATGQAGDPAHGLLPARTARRAAGALPPLGRMAGAAAPAAAAPPVPAHLIVKLRGALERGLAAAARPASGSVDVAAAAASEPAVAALVARHGVRSAAPLYPARVRVRSQRSLSDAQLAAANRQRFAPRAARAPAGATPPDLASTYVLDVGSKPRAAIEQAVATLAADPDVVYVEEDKRVQPVFVPNDPRYPELYGLANMGAAQSWDTVRGNGIVVAVTDTGLDFTHADIDANVWTNPGEVAGNGVDDDGNGLVDDFRGWDFVGPSWTSPAPDNDPSDVHGHGTHVAGTIAAEGNNATGVVGVAFGARIMALRGLDDSGNGGDVQLANAIVYAADEGADVINASWGGAGASQTIKDAIDYAHSLGVLFVAAAGNANADAGGFHPADVAKALKVAAVDRFDAKASFSNFGSEIDVSAPGVDVLSLESGTGGYVLLSGTSMAAPHVSGLAALVMQARPTFTLEQIRQVLRTSAVDIGAAGRDLVHGYGRVSASAAVQVSQALEAKFFAPVDGVAINAPVGLVGTARGPGFVRYIVERGAGTAPTTWTSLVNTTTQTPAAGGTLTTFNPSTLADGVYTVRLRAIDSGNRTFSDQIQIRVRYLQLTNPPETSTPALYAELKPGNTVTVTGRATGPTFQSFRLEWAPGANATSGFSTAGITLAGGGTSPVTSGTLGTWTPPATGLGEHTLRLSVVNTGFTSTATTTVYLQRDLVGNPLFLSPDNSYATSPIPARMADGSTRFIQYGYSIAGAGGVPAAVPIRSITAAGVVANTVQLDRSNIWEPSVGELDTSLAGQEVLVVDFRRLRILRADLTPVREITTAPLEAFDFDRVSLADVDGDGTMEIIALARDVDDPTSGFYRPFGSLYVFRSNGQLYSPNYPVRLTSTRMPNGYQGADVAAVELNGSGSKELVITLQDSGSTIYEIQARNADGTVHAAWPNPTPSFPSQSSSVEIVASDLDRDGRSEMAFWEVFNFGATMQLRVLNSNGATRAGWPLAVTATGAIAIGDLDRDQRDEIVFAPHQQPVQVRRPDGTLFGGTWPTLANPSAAVIADVDNDSFPDVVISETAINFNADPRYFDVRMKVLSRTGALTREWRQFGIAGQQALASYPAVGDFNGDGRTDIACHLPTVAGNGGTDGVLLDGAFTVLTTNANVNPAGDDWPLVNRDPQNSRSRLVALATLPQPATNPNPANGATGVSISATLAWTAGAGATSHDVYFGTANPPAFRVNQTGTTFNPGALTASTTYFWRIDGKNAAGTRTGTVWSFTTGTSCTAETNAAFCTRLGKNCGQVSGTDNCGAARTVASCGTCTSPQTCGGGGMANVCGGGGGSAPCSDLCTGPTTFAGPSYNSGNLGTGAVCRETLANLTGANCGNFAAARTFRVNNELRTCTGGNITLPAKRNGGYCFQASTGDFAWAYFTTW